MTIPEPTRPIQIHQSYFEATNKFAIQIMEMVDSFFVWVGPADQEIAAQLGPLAVAMPPRFGSAIGSTLLKPTVENESEAIAKKLSTRFKKQFFVSLNGIGQDVIDFRTIEQKVFECIGQLC